MIIGAEAMRAVCREIHAVMVDKIFGTKGVDALFIILDTVREVYRHVEPTRVAGTIIIFCPIDSTEPVLQHPVGESVSDMDWLTPRSADGFILEISASGRKRYYPIGTFNVADLAKRGVVYAYQNKREYFYAGNDCKEVIPFIPAAASQFSVPTFFTLQEALRRYADTYIRHSACPVFNRTWSDDCRLFFKPGPEEEMRRSLTSFLKSRLGAGYEVRPEQVMDESHPVDIKVTYSPANRLMIIEIKWLGDSRNDKGGMGTSHRDARAKQGAEQLAGYLDQNKVQAPLHVTHGYYVIIDARRRGLREDSKKISKADGLHFQTEEIEFDPKFHELRNDFDVPYRMFVEPIYEP